jgi:hypothetical protein
MQKTFKDFMDILERATFIDLSSSKEQARMEKEIAKREKEKIAKMRQRSDELYHERTRGRGIRATSGGRKGWIKDGKFTPDEDS